MPQPATYGRIRVGLAVAADAGGLRAGTFLTVRHPGEAVRTHPHVRLGGQCSTEEL
ncbi:MAG: hypothetical protein JWO42_70, partial [Chloroflexi bacterium]|nr:hypothetical protein [Chloroflexota bacterium]